MAGRTRLRRRHARRTSWLAVVRGGVLPGRSRRRRGAPTRWGERGSALVEASASRSWSRG